MSLIEKFKKVFGAQEKPAAQPEDKQYTTEERQRRVEDLISQVAGLLVTANRLEAQAKDVQKEIEKYTSIAQDAAKSGNRQDVAGAVELKLQASEKLSALETSIDKYKALAQKLREEIAAEKERISSNEDSKEQLKAEIAGSEIREQLAKEGTQLNEDRELAKLKETAVEKEGQAEAWEDVANLKIGRASAGGDIKTQYAQQQKDAEVEKYMSEAK